MRIYSRLKRQLARNDMERVNATIREMSVSFREVEKIIKRILFLGKQCEKGSCTEALKLGFDEQVLKDLVDVLRRKRKSEGRQG